MVLIILGGVPAFAGNSSRGFSYQGSSSGPITIQSQYNIVDTRGGIIYNLTLNAGSANAVMTIYDSGNSSNPTETPIYEIEVAVAGDSRTVDFSTAPLSTYSGITASVTNGVGYINVEK